MDALATYAAVCEELDRRRRVTLGLDRIRRLLAALDDPHRRVRVVQVVGTNGKGTTAVALAAALEAAGHSSGAYLSPHLISYTERIVLRGRYVSEERFADAMRETIAIADASGIEASQFELLTAGAIKLYADEGLDWAVLEAGLGARHDATTAASPEAVVLTNVDLDHTELLGETVEEIATEKLASVAPGATLILGTDDSAVVRLARARCEETGARLVEAGEQEEPPAVGMPSYALRDARLGARAAEVLLGGALTEAKRERVLRSVAGFLPGRFEVREIGGVPVLLDGGHNAAGIQAALEAAKSYGGERPLLVVFGALRDKDIGSMLTGLRDKARALVLTRPEGDRAADPFWVAREYEPRDLGGRQARVVADAVEALGAAVEEAREVGGVVLVTGSLFTCAPVLRWLREG